MRNSVHRATPRRTVGRLTLALLIASTATVLTGAASPELTRCGTINAATIAKGINTNDCAERELIIKVGSLGAVAPDPGEAVTAVATTTTGDEVHLEVIVDLDGSIRASASPDLLEPRELSAMKAEASRGHSTQRFVVEKGPIAAAVAGAAKARYSRCTDSSYTYKRHRWRNGYAPYLINTSAERPGSISATNLANEIHAARLVWPRGTNSCGMTIKPLILNPTSIGVTLDRANMKTSEDVCGKRDEKNVVDFGKLGSSLGLSCTWRNVITDVAWESDIRLNSKQKWFWGKQTCTSQYDIRGVLVHEFGHFLGMDHVKEVQAGDLVMSPQSSPCDTSQRTLGRGDLLGISARY